MSNHVIMMVTNQSEFNQRNLDSGPDPFSGGCVKFTFPFNHSNVREKLVKCINKYKANLHDDKNRQIHQFSIPVMNAKF